ncbi:MAG: PIG-L family deacetylase [Caldilineaceae bacterium]
MTTQPKLMGIFAHPDDETLGAGGVFAKYGAEGVETYLVMATRGERGWQGEPTANPGLEALGAFREQELRSAAALLGIRQIDFLNYIDGDLDQAQPAEIIAKLVGYIRRVRPQVVITFGPDGSYGHPDHIAISQFTTAAIMQAANPAYSVADGCAPHQVAKLYYMVDSVCLAQTLHSLGVNPAIRVDGYERRLIAWEEWAITTWVDTSAHWRTVLAAVACHRSQLPNLEEMKLLPDDTQRHLWGCGTFYRALSLVNGGRRVEHDLFEGIPFANGKELVQ